MWEDGIVMAAVTPGAPKPEATVYFHVGNKTLQVSQDELNSRLSFPTQASGIPSPCGNA
jgi:hypothetical protein